MTALESELAACREKLDRLLDLHIEGGISSEEYRAKKNKIVCSSSEIEEKIRLTREQASDWLEPGFKEARISSRIN